MSIEQLKVFPEELDWINGEPLTMEDQRGRIVVLLFWSAGSAYCQNLMMEVQQVLAKHSESTTLIAVHSPKFEAERDAGVVLKTVNRIGFRHPVAHDPSFALWQQFDVNSWPTMVLLDHKGSVAGALVGDDQKGNLDHAVARMLDELGPDEREYENHPPVFKPEPRLPLAFPSGLAVTANHLYVADTGHHRILECTHDGRILRQFGTGNPGLVDGHTAESHFNMPRGLCIIRDALYVADSGSHALRRIALLNGEADTLAGNGQRGGLDGYANLPPEQCPMDAPWAVAGSFDKLFIAMAGAHQIWEYDQVKRSMRVLSGTGQFGLSDASGERTLLAQPAALALIQQTLYMADSAASAIRGVHTLGGQTHTLIGQGVYDFGDHEGARHVALLQYPTGLALDVKAPKLWIADTYNNQIKTLRLGGGELKRYELNYPLRQPAAVASSDGVLWIANTNAHEILRVDVETRQVKRLPIGE
ncbi:MAG: redoxin domain-containing protein [Xanthomonadales bacterium]|nr:redoxin domain-containing protein [Xanthomonadales bacterium]